MSLTLQQVAVAMDLEWNCVFLCGFCWQDHKVGFNKRHRIISNVQIWVTVYRKQTEQLGFNRSLTLCFPIKGSNENSSIVWQETQRLPNRQTRFAKFHSSGAITTALVEFRMINYDAYKLCILQSKICLNMELLAAPQERKFPLNGPVKLEHCISNNLWRIKLKCALGT